MTNFCTSCGAAAKSVTRFCEACGAPFKPPDTAQAAPVPAAHASDLFSPTRPTRFTMIVIGSLVIIMALGIGGYVMWTKKKEADAEALRVEQARLAEVQRQQEIAQGKQLEQARLAEVQRQREIAQHRQLELDRKLHEEAEIRKKTETARREAVALAAAEAEARRVAEERARALHERASSARPNGGSMSGGFAAASQAARRGDNASAVSACQRSAQEGDARCQYLIGWLYATGKVGNRSEAELRLAADLMGKAANQGLATAQFNFGVMNERGLGVRRDVDAAIGWYKKAANQGDSNARQALAKLATN